MGVYISLYFTFKVCLQNPRLIALTVGSWDLAWRIPTLNLTHENADFIDKEVDLRENLEEIYKNKTWSLVSNYS